MQYPLLKVLALFPYLKVGGPIFRHGCFRNGFKNDGECPPTSNLEPRTSNLLLKSSEDDMALHGEFQEVGIGLKAKFAHDVIFMKGYGPRR